MKIKELDMVELLNGKVCTILNVFDTPSLGYFVESEDTDEQSDDDVSIVKPEDISRIVYVA